MQMAFRNTPPIGRKIARVFGVLGALGVASIGAGLVVFGFMIWFWLLRSMALPF